MKNSMLIIVLLLWWTGQVISQTSGTLTVTATTSAAGGNYAPKNIVAIWIEDDQGNFVKTLMAYAQSRRTHLNTWEASTTASGSPFNSVDAITGPTRTNHGTRTCSWNATDVLGNTVDDGTYHVWMELTDKNSTGNFSSFSFSKDTLPSTQNPLNVPSFSSISIVWDPVLTAVDERKAGIDIAIYPNPTSGVFTVNGEEIIYVMIHNSGGRLIYEGVKGKIDISDHPDGVYLLKVTTRKGPVFRKILKN